MGFPDVRERILEPGAVRTRVTDRLRASVVRQRLRCLTWRRCGRRYAAPISPTAVLELEPTAVDRVLTPGWRDRLAAAAPAHVQTVAGGDWGLEAAWFVAHPVYRAHRRRAVEDVPHSGSTLAAEPGPGHGRSSAAASSGGRPVADGGLDPLETCYADVAAAGYRSVRQRRRERARPASPPAFDPYPSLPPAKGEIRVCVGRDGRFVLHGGHHRLAIARLLDVETVPVHVLIRHERWQARRDRVVLTGSDTGDHPDLADLEPRRAVSR